MNATGSVVPVFPLPSVFLFPGTLLPLHVFEPRYRQMVRDLLDSSGYLVIGTRSEETPEQTPGAPEDEAPDILPTAGLGRLENYHAFSDGRFVIVVLGLDRVKIRETESPRLYRQVTVEVLEETPEPPEETKFLRSQLREAICEMAGEDVSLPDEMPVSRLTDLLLMYLKLPSMTMERLYMCLEVADRARAALAHLQNR